MHWTAHMGRCHVKMVCYAEVTPDKLHCARAHHFECLMLLGKKRREGASIFEHLLCASYKWYLIWFSQFSEIRIIIPIWEMRRLRPRNSLSWGCNFKACLLFWSPYDSQDLSSAQSLSALHVDKCTISFLLKIFQNHETWWYVLHLSFLCRNWGSY